MQTTYRLGLWCTSLAWVLLFATRSHAEARLSYAAPPGCPDAAAFRRSLGHRVGARFDSTPRDVPPMRVSIEQQEGTFVGELNVSANGTESTRQLEAPHCEELVDALAFLAAVTIGLGVGDSAPAPPSIPPPSPPPRAVETPHPAQPERWRFALGADASLLSWPGPSLALGPEPFLEARHEAGIFAPTIRLSGMRVSSAEVHASTGAGTASFTLTAARLEGCPVEWGPARSLHFLPCLGVRGGVLEGVGEHVATPRTENRAWLSAELLARAEWAPLSWLFFEIQGGASFAILRYEFFFDPEIPVTETGAFGGFAGAGGGFRLPW